MNPLDTYFVNQSHNPGKLTFVNASFWEKRTAIHKPRRPFNFDLKTYPSRTILREVSRVSSLILRAKPWLAKKVLRHGNRFVARVRRRYFSEGEKRRREMRLRFAGYKNLNWYNKSIKDRRYFMESAGERYLYPRGVLVKARVKVVDTLCFVLARDIQLFIINRVLCIKRFTRVSMGWWLLWLSA